MNSRVFRKCLVLTTILMIAFGLPTMALNGYKTLQAYYGVRILYNNQLLSGTQEPFIVNGTTYVPLRMLMDTFGDKQIAWDAYNYQVIINSSVSQLEQQYLQQLNARNETIKTLEDRVKALEAQNTLLVKESNLLDLEDLEDDLNYAYQDAEELNLEIRLSGDKDRISLLVQLDEEDWADVLVHKKENLLQDICDDIWSEAQNSNITGKVRDGTKVLSKFFAEPDENIDLDEIDISVLEDYLKNRYGNFGTLDPVITLAGDTDEIDLTLTVTEAEWEALTINQKEGLLTDICEDIWDNADNADINVRVMDGGATLETQILNPGEDIKL